MKKNSLLIGIGCLLLLAAFLATVIFTPMVNAGSKWLQTSDTDFSTGTLTNVIIKGMGEDAQIELAKVDGDWTQKSSSNTPSPRAEHAMTTIYNEDKIVLFGGYDGSAYKDDTWVYDLSDQQWYLKSLINKPSARAGYAMASVYNDDKILLFGGYDGSAYKGDTWFYDLSDEEWTQESPSNKPFPRAGHAMASVYNDDKVVLFGGYDGINRLDDTWVYDLSDKQWTKKDIDAKPSARSAHAMATIYNDDKIVLFGGYDGSACRGGTWVYDLSDDQWEEKSPSNEPSPRRKHAMATIYNDDKVVLFGGKGSVSHNDDTWIYDLNNNQWYKKFSSNKPSARSAHAIGGIYNNDRVVLFGGYDSSAYKHDTWVYDPAVYSSGDFRSQYNDTGGNSDFISIYWTATTPADTSLKFQLRTADTQSSLASKNFVGPDGTVDSYYTDSGSTIWTGHNGDRWLQYKAYLSTTNPDDTPVLKDITINYNRLPNAPTLTNPTNNAWTNNNKPTFKWKFSDPDSQAQGGFQWQADDDKEFGSIDYDSGVVSSSTESYIPSSAIADGTWYWRIKTKDNDGSWGHYSGYWIVKVDTTLPNAFTPTANPSSWTNTNPQVSFSTTDATSGIDHYEVKIDDGAFSTQTSPYTLPAQSDGIHTITVRAYDKAMNYIDSTVNVYIDTTKPNVFNPTANPDSWTNTNPKVSFSTTDATSGIDHYEVKIDDGAFSTQTSPYTLPAQSDGIHTITVRAYDKAMNYIDS
ncbi:MAG: kelch repeat-containing protein, partial [Candidatus Thermoplasmatota archaeon]